TSSGVELCCPPQRLPVAMAGDLLAVGGQFLLLGLALACGGWRILQGVMAAGLGLCLLYGPGRSIPLWWRLQGRAEAGTLCPPLVATMGPCGGRGALSPSGGGAALLSLPRLTSCPLPPELDSICHLPAAAQISFRSLLSCRNIWKNVLILGFTTFIAHAIRHCYRLAWGSLRGPRAEFYLSYLLSAGSAGLACLFLCLSVDRYGRRGILLLSTTLTGIASLILLGLGECKGAPGPLGLGAPQRHAPGLLGSLGGEWGTHTLSLSLCRGRGLGLILGLAALGGLSAPLLWLREQHGSFLQHIVLASLTILCLLCLLLLPESKRKGLPDGLREGELYRRPSLLRRAGGAEGRGVGGSTRRDDVPLLSTPNPSS
uniref:Solute carrier family 22 member 17 n=1 Tax=Sphenodon punctatus TaxID=8508 RepID=A0A8D0HM26_SPHPU